MAEHTELGGKQVNVYRHRVIVVGTGAAGYNAADSLWENGVHDVAIVTEGVFCGTSRNTGSDKQTYYKLSLSGGQPDSVHDMASDLFSGGCVDGDTALCEAAMSVPCFMKLCRLGVDFPTNRYGEYVGYQTDHDVRGRATSVGPLTSKKMTEALERAVRLHDIPVYDGFQVIALLSDHKRCFGIQTYSPATGEFSLFLSEFVIYAVGGPAGIFARTVYPEGHHGASGIAFEAGAQGQNLTEWQFGLASTAPRWNVSGTYMQVLPRIFSVDEQGIEHEFICEYYNDLKTALSMLFLKGYQWPFDAAKTNASSLIDLLVYREESMLGRKVFFDYTRNMSDTVPAAELLSEEAAGYLAAAGAVQETPVERLLCMNPQAYEYYFDHGVDLKKDFLPVSLCAQHNNGGLAVDLWWQSNLTGLFPVGEAAGTHGISRPGGSALNAGQVGSARAARFIAMQPEREAFALSELPQSCIRQAADLINLSQAAHSGQGNVKQCLQAARMRMDLAGGAVCSEPVLREALAATQRELHSLQTAVRADGPQEISDFFLLRDTLIAQTVYLSAMCDYCAAGGGSRGSAIYTERGGTPCGTLPEAFSHRPDGRKHRGEIQQVEYNGGEPVCSRRPVRPLPEGGGFFEAVWRSYRENKNTY